jgi:dynein heavy chain 1
LPEVESPEWAGLPGNAEKLLKSQEALSAVSKLVSIQGTGDDELAYSEKAEETKSAWLVSLNERVIKLIDMLPASLPALHRTALSITNPLFRFLEREIQVGTNLLNEVRGDLFSLKEMSAGNQKFTNPIRQIAQDLHTDVIPKKWRKY